MIVRKEISISIGLSYPIYTYKSFLSFQKKKGRQRKRERERGRKILNDHVCPTKWRLHRVSVSAFSRFSPDGPSIFILPMNLLRNLSLFIYPFSLRTRGTTILSFLSSCGTLSASGSGTGDVLRKCERLGLSRLLHRERTGRGLDALGTVGTKDRAIFFALGSKPPDNYEDRYHLCNNRRDH